MARLYKRDFERVAAVLRKNGADKVLVEEMADALSGFNENFQRGRFIDAATQEAGR